MPDYSLNDPVFVHHKLEGVVAFVGPVSFADGDDWVGIRLTGKSAFMGRNDGSVKHQRYFQCPPHCGLFVRQAALEARPCSPSEHMDRPEILELTFPSQDSLAFWKDSRGASLLSPCLWVWDGACYRAPFKEFRLYFVPAPDQDDTHSSVVGRWCIYTGQIQDFEGGFFCQDTDIPKTVSPAHSIPYNTWNIRFGQNIEVLGTVSCQAVPRQHVCRAIENYITTKAGRMAHETSARGVGWGHVIWEDLKNLQGRTLLPWLKENLHSLLRWTHEAYSLGRYHQAECATSIIFLLLGNDNLLQQLSLDDQTLQNPFLWNSPEAKPFAQQILKLPPGKVNFNDIGCGALNNLILKSIQGWQSVILSTDLTPLQVLHNLVRTHLENSQAESPRTHASSLLSTIYDGLMEAALDNRNFDDDPEAQQTLRKICFLVAEAIHEKKSQAPLTQRLAQTLGSLVTTGDIYKQEEGTLIDPTWWKQLPDSVKEKLNGDAPERFLCPITHEIMRNPSFLSSSGHTYDRYAISWWMKKTQAVDPRTNVRIPEGAELFPNKDLSLEICHWCEDEAKRLMGNN